MAFRQLSLAVSSYSSYWHTCKGGRGQQVLVGPGIAANQTTNFAAKSYIQDNKAADDFSGPCQVQFVHFPEVVTQTDHCNWEQKNSEQLCKRYIPYLPLTRSPDLRIQKLQHNQTTLLYIIHSCHGYRTTRLLDFPKPIPISNRRYWTLTRRLPFIQPYHISSEYNWFCSSLEILYLTSLDFLRLRDVLRICIPQSTHISTRNKISISAYTHRYRHKLFSSRQPISEFNVIITRSCSTINHRKTTRD